MILGVALSERNEETGTTLVEQLWMCRSLAMSLLAILYEGGNYSHQVCY